MQSGATTGGPGSPGAAGEGGAGVFLPAPPLSHETFYYNSGYFYLFGHYYAARLVNQLPAEQREEYWPRLRYEVAKLQQKDGSMYDYDMHAYHKPYGIAFGLLTLAESVDGDGS